MAARWVVRIGQKTNNSNRNFNLTMAAEDDALQDRANGNISVDWMAEDTSEDRVRLYIDGSEVIVGTWSVDAEIHTITVERRNGEEWELFFDNISQGKTTNTFSPNVSEHGIWARSGVLDHQVLSYKIGSISEVGVSE